MANKSIQIILLILPCFSASLDVAADTLYQGGRALNSSDTLVSKNGLFILGFVSLGSDESNSSYLGIWYNESESSTIQPFWIANRNKPIADNSGVLAIDGKGNMKLSYSGGDLVDLYSSQSSNSNLTAILEDSGNFVLKDANSNGYEVLWQSFDYPTNTLLPGMKLGVNHKTNQTWSLVSWLSNKIPSSGAFALEWDPSEQELVIKRRGIVYWTSGSLKSNGSFENAFDSKSELDFSFINVSNADEDYFMFTAARNQFSSQDLRNFSMWWLRYDGAIENRPRGLGFGGGSTICRGSNTDAGCQKWAGPSCRTKRDSFEYRVGYFVNTVPIREDKNASLSISDCMDICWKTCSCVATIDTNMYNSGDGTGCTFYYGSFTQDLSGTAAGRYYVIARHGTTVKSWVWVLVSVAAVLIMALVVCIVFYWRKRKLKEKFLNDLMTSDATRDVHELQNDGNKGQNLKVYSVATIMAATNGFSPQNKLGQGGFGPVYKGKLPEGRVIAIKRLSRSSGQGLVEFKNELTLIAKLQHVNLVRLLGCCIHGEEKMLVYEYMPNKSLDSFIFDQSKRGLLDWRKRFEIIDGIAQGLLYLHKYSRLRIIHRDLKASNILLDENLIPKISDFGMARIFNINTSEANTNRVVGTYGYMSPEYAMEGIFSVKSDVFSFGVLVLEIVSGRKIHGLIQLDRPLNLVGYAWELWKEGDPFELVDQTVRDSCSPNQVLRCINVGLLCVEDSALDRPSMSDVISMLTSEAQLPMPKQPAFTNARSAFINVESSSSKQEISSRNDLTMSSIDAR